MVVGNPRVGLVVMGPHFEVAAQHGKSTAAETAAITDHQGAVGTELQPADSAQLQFGILLRVFFPFLVRENEHLHIATHGDGAVFPNIHAENIFVGNFHRGPRSVFVNHRFTRKSKPNCSVGGFANVCHINAFNSQAGSCENRPIFTIKLDDSLLRA